MRAIGLQLYKEIVTKTGKTAQTGRQSEGNVADSKLYRVVMNGTKKSTSKGKDSSSLASDKRYVKESTEMFCRQVS